MFCVKYEYYMYVGSSIIVMTLRL